MSHTIRHLLGCLLPLMLIFVLPLFGVDQGVALLVFIVLMFACHLLLMSGHRHEDQSNHTARGSTNHEHH